VNALQAIDRIKEIEDVLWHVEKLEYCLEKEGYEFEKKIMEKLKLKFNQEANELNSRLSKIVIQ
jgi:hypothetical protein